MPARRDAASDLAARLLHVLSEQRDRGPEAYPLTVRRLVVLAQPDAPEALVFKTLARKKDFAERTLVAQPKSLDAPIALVEDLLLLAASPLLLSFALDLACSPEQPTIEIGKLAAKVVPRLRPHFLEALRRQAAEKTLPAHVRMLEVRKKIHLHDQRFPLPKPPEVRLAEDLVRILRGLQGTPRYPASLEELVQQTGSTAPAALLKKALTLPLFQEQALVAIKNRPDSPVALATDRAGLVKSPRLLEKSLHLLRTSRHQISTLADIKRKLVPSLQTEFQAALVHQIETGTLPPSVGCLLQKSKPLLFLMSEFKARAPAPPASAVQVPAEDFAEAFERAFIQLEKHARMANYVSLLDLRRALPVERQAFDAGLHALRVAGRYTLSAAEGRHGLSPEERAAGIHEGGALLLYVSRKLP